MKQVIHIPENNTENDKPVELKSRIGNEGWLKDSYINPNNFMKIIYLGKCEVDGDMFACYNTNKTILICKGHLNSGKY